MLVMREVQHPQENPDELDVEHQPPQLSLSALAKLISQFEDLKDNRSKINRNIKRAKSIKSAVDRAFAPYVELYNECHHSGAQRTTPNSSIIQPHHIAS